MSAGSRRALSHTGAGGTGRNLPPLCRVVGAARLAGPVRPGRAAWAPFVRHHGWKTCRENLRWWAQSFPGTRAQGEVPTGARQEGKGCPGLGTGQAEPGWDGSGERGSPSHCTGWYWPHGNAWPWEEAGSSAKLTLPIENPFPAQSRLQLRAKDEDVVMSRGCSCGRRRACGSHLPCQALPCLAVPSACLGQLRPCHHFCPSSRTGHAPTHPPILLHMGKPRQRV